MRCLVPYGDSLDIHLFCALCSLVPVRVVLESFSIKYLGEVVVMGKPKTRAQ
jgi:hypothetical protein